MQDGAFSNLFSLAIYDDLNLCYNDTLVMMWDGYDSFVYGMTGNITMSVRSLLLMIHEAPVVYSDCLVLFNDIKYLDEMFDTYDDVSSIDMYIHVFENLMFNLADIYFNFD